MGPNSHAGRKCEGSEAPEVAFAVADQSGKAVGHRSVHRFRPWLLGHEIIGSIESTHQHHVHWGPVLHCMRRVCKARPGRSEVRCVATTFGGIQDVGRLAGASEKQDGRTTLAETWRRPTSREEDF